MVGPVLNSPWHKGGLRNENKEEVVQAASSEEPAAQGWSTYTVDLPSFSSSEAARDPLLESCDPLESWWTGGSGVACAESQTDACDSSSFVLD